MSKMIQLRNVPDELHRKLKERAARSGLSLSDYLVQEISRVAATPTIDEVFDRLHALEPVRSSVSSADAIREERDKR